VLDFIREPTLLSGVPEHLGRPFQDADCRKRGLVGFYTRSAGGPNPDAGRPAPRPAPLAVLSYRASGRH